jgi:hypothetical protein
VDSQSADSLTVQSGDTLQDFLFPIREEVIFFGNPTIRNMPGEEGGIPTWPP